MAAIYVDQGLRDMADAIFGLTAADAIDAMSVSNFGALAAGTTDIASATFKQVNGLNAGASRTGNVVTVSADFTDAQIGGNEITTICLHNDGAGVTTGVQMGVDGQSATFDGVDVTIEFEITYSSG